MFKLLKIIFGIIIFIIIAVIAFGITLIVLNRNNKPKQKSFTSTNAVSNVVIDVKDSFVTVKQSKTEFVNVTYYASETRTFDIEETSDTLTVKGYQTGKWYNRIFLTFKGTKVYETVVEVPDDINVTLKTDNGNINVVGVDSAALKAETTNGGIMLKNVNSTSQQLESTNGNIEINSCNVTTSFKGKTKKGKILLDHLVSLVTIDANTDSGNIVVDNSYATGDITLHTGKGNITGTVRLLSDAYYKITAKAKNGQSNLNNTTSGIAELNVTTDNGNIELELKNLLP